MDELAVILQVTVMLNEVKHLTGHGETLRR